MPDEVSRVYPEANANCLSTHCWVHLMSSTVDEAVENYLAQFGMSSGRFGVLTALEFTKEGLRPSQLAEALNVTQATITGLIDSLVKSGLVRRKDCKGDRRVCFIRLTPRGQRFVAEHRPAFHQWLESLYSVWTDEEMQLMNGLLQRFCQSLAKPLRSGQTSAQTLAPLAGAGL